VEIIAHRGACFSAPENSLRAFALAMEGGADRLECDVHITRDGIPVVCHDSTTKRTTNLDLEIATSTFEEVRAAQMPDGSRIPSFDELCALVSGQSRLDVEMKVSGALLSRLVVASLGHHAVSADAIITSFDPDALLQCRDAGFQGRTGLLIGSRSLSPLQRAYEAWPLRAVEAAKADVLAIHFALAHGWLRSALKKKGIGLLLWASIEDEEKRPDERAARYVRMRMAEPDGVIVGRVREARALIEASADAARWEEGAAAAVIPEESVDNVQTEE
jgi:glycerophosphoryl diester phosphodiesterase